MATAADRRIQLLQRCLDRRDSIQSLAALRRAALGEDKTGRPGGSDTLAIGLDTNAVFRLGTDQRNTDAVDYLATKHSGPLILPGQVVQEYWNSQLSAIATQPGVVRAKYRALADEIDKVDGSFGSYKERFDALLTDFATTYAFAFDPRVLTRLASLLEMLQKRATVSYVPRSSFHPIAAARDGTRTPPGFKDGGFGDFYVWADFLLGLLSVRDGGTQFHKAVLITADEKVDWSRGGQAHPILVAEVELLLSIPFETWNLDALREYVASELGGSGTATAEADAGGGERQGRDDQPAAGSHAGEVAAEPPVNTAPDPQS